MARTGWLADAYRNENRAVVSPRIIIVISTSSDDARPDSGQVTGRKAEKLFGPLGPRLPGPGSGIRHRLLIGMLVAVVAVAGLSSAVRSTPGEAIRLTALLVVAGTIVGLTAAAFDARFPVANLIVVAARLVAVVGMVGLPAVVLGEPWVQGPAASGWGWSVIAVAVGAAGIGGAVWNRRRALAGARPLVPPIAHHRLAAVVVGVPLLGLALLGISLTTCLVGTPWLVAVAVAATGIAALFGLGSWLDRRSVVRGTNRGLAVAAGTMIGAAYAVAFVIAVSTAVISSTQPCSEDRALVTPVAIDAAPRPGTAN